jgi:hypothetical protein
MSPSSPTNIDTVIEQSLTQGHRDIQVLKTYGAAPYGAAIKKLEQQIKEKQTSVDEKIGVKVRMRRTPKGPFRDRTDSNMG